jgi:hypothetical protein
VTCTEDLTSDAGRVDDATPMLETSIEVEDTAVEESVMIIQVLTYKDGEDATGEDDIGLRLQTPKPGWHPVPQQSFPLPTFLISTILGRQGFSYIPIGVLAAAFAKIPPKTSHVLR